MDMCNSVEGKAMNMRLVGWKDQDMVYCLTLDCNTSETDMCFRITQWGIIELQLPIFILQLSKFMGRGGVPSIYVATLLQCNDYGTELMVVKVVLVFP